MSIEADTLTRRVFATMKHCDDTCVSKQAKTDKKRLEHPSQGSSSGAFSALTALKCADSDRAGAGEACREFIGRTGAFKACRHLQQKSAAEANVRITIASIVALK